ncbi:MAG TPA: phosphoribosyltransferase family protein [Candidatus Saccharimonadales bacterium]|nr:phosphoribosyltransferase family protein [Candidatus Saccharimonadales bacterium]
MTAIPDDAVRETWQSVYDDSLKLAELIAADCRDSGERSGFDAMVVVPRGGYYPANIVARRLGFEAADMLQASVGSYESGTTERRPEFRLGQMPTDEQVAGKKPLIIDEVCDTGYTLQLLVERFKKQGAAEVRTGVLHYKPHSSRTGLVPDWFVNQTGKWIVYPWEESDTIEI